MTQPTGKFARFGQLTPDFIVYDMSVTALPWLVPGGEPLISMRAISLSGPSAQHQPAGRQAPAEPRPVTSSQVASTDATAPNINTGVVQPAALSLGSVTSASLPVITSSTTFTSGSATATSASDL